MQHLYKTRYCSLIVSRDREARMLGVLYKRKGRLVMAIAARVLVLVKSMEMTRSYSYYFAVVGDGQLQYLLSTYYSTYRLSLWRQFVGDSLW